MNIWHMMMFFMGMFVLMKGTTIVSRKLERKAILTLLTVFTVALLGLGLSILYISEDDRIFMLVGGGLLASIITGLGHGLKGKKKEEN